MLRKSSSPFGAYKAARMPSSVDAAPRDFNLEQLICKAIRQRVILELKYEDDALFRSFEPTPVYRTSQDKVCVSGVQMKNRNDLLDNSGPHNFEVGLIKDVRLTGISFSPGSRFNRLDPRYRNGVICSI